MNKRLAQTLITFLIFVLHIEVTLGQQVSGYIEDAKSGERLPYANIYTPDMKLGTTSNSFGYFGLKLTPNTKELIVSYTGFDPTIINLQGIADTFLIVKIESSNQLDEVIISESQNHEVLAPQMGKIEFQKAQLKKTPAIFGEPDIMKLAQLMPGVQATHGGFSALIVRGGKPDQNLILLDGVTVYNTSHLFGLYSVINENAIQSAQLIKGNFPSQYGGRLSSVMDITLKEGNSNKIKGELSVGMVGGKFLVEGPVIDDKTTFCISGRRTLLDVFYEPYLMLAEDETNGYFFADLNAKVSRKLSSNDRLYLSFYYGKDKNYKSAWGETIEISDTPYDLETKEGYKWGNYTSSFRWNHIWSPSLFSNSTLIFTDFYMGHYDKSKLTDKNEDKSYNDNIEYTSGIKDFGFKQDFDFVGIQKHHVKFGGSWIQHEFSPGITAFVKENVFNGTNLDASVGPDASTFGELNLYVNDEWQIAPFLRMNIGARYVYSKIGAKAFNFIEPRISSAFQLNKKLAIKASYSVNNQLLHLIRSSALELPTDLWVPASEELSPEHAWQVALGADWAINNTYFVSVEGYYKEMENIIEYKEGSSMFSNKNSWNDKVELGTGEAYGGELLFQKKYGKTTGWISYSLSWAYNQFDNINLGNKFYSTWDRRHDFAIALQHRFSEKWDIASNWVYTSGAPFSVPLYKVKENKKLAGFSKDLYLEKNNMRMPAYHRLDVSVNYTVQSKKRKGRTHEFSFSVYNAYNHENVLYMGYFWGRQAKASVFSILPSLSYTIKLGDGKNK